MALQSSSYESMHQDHGQAPKPRQRSGGLVIVLVIGFALIAAILIPGVRTRMDKFFATSGPKTVNMGLRVWANKEGGNYYCPGSKFFGRGNGTYMKQGDALTLGYQPALGGYCEEGESPESKSLVRSTRHVAQSGGLSPNPSSRTHLTL